jgi:hypothetical protein
VVTQDLVMIKAVKYLALAIALGVGSGQAVGGFVPVPEIALQ